MALIPSRSATRQALAGSVAAPRPKNQHPAAKAHEQWLSAGYPATFHTVVHCFCEKLPGAGPLIPSSATTGRPAAASCPGKRQSLAKPLPDWNNSACPPASHTVIHRFCGKNPATARRPGDCRPPSGDTCPQLCRTWASHRQSAWIKAGWKLFPCSPQPCPRCLWTASVRQLSACQPATHGLARYPARGKRQTAFSGLVSRTIPPARVVQTGHRLWQQAS